MIIEELIALLGFKVEGEGNLQRFQGGLDRVRGSVNNLTTGFARAGAGMKAFMGGFAGGLLGGAALGALDLVKDALLKVPRDIIRTGAEVEELTVQLNNLMGSSAAAQEAMNWLITFAKKTPLSLQDTNQAFVELKAYGIDPMDGSLMSLVDTMAGTGKGMEALDGIIMAFGQANAKGKLQQEEMNQLIERGIPIYELLAKVTGKNKDELDKLQQSGKLGKKVIRDVLDELGRRNRGAAEAMSRTWKGVISNIGDAWDSIMRSIGRVGVFDRFKGVAESIKDLFEGLDDSGAISRPLADLMGSFTLFKVNLEQFLASDLFQNWHKTTEREAEALGNLLSRVFGQDLATNTTRELNTISTAFSTMGTAIKNDFVTGLRQIGPAITAVFEELKNILHGDSSLAADFKAAGVSAGAAWAEGFKSAADRVVGAVRSLIGGLRFSPTTGNPQLERQTAPPGGRVSPSPLAPTINPNSLKRSASLGAPRGIANQSVTNHIAVNVQGGPGDSGKQIGDRVADRLANMKNLYFTSAGPVSA
jgi:tape measure domain-containing protein